VSRVVPWSHRRHRITEPTATLEDFNGEWCDAVFPLRRAIDDLPTLKRDARTIETLDESVDRFDALASGLSEAGFDEVAADARQMADALNDLGDALDALADASFVEAGTDLSVTRGMRSAVCRSTTWPKRSATVPSCLRVARRTGRSGRCSSECCGKATAKVGAARTGDTKRLRAAAWIVASTPGV